MIKYCLLAPLVLLFVAPACSRKPAAPAAPPSEPQAQSVSGAPTAEPQSGTATAETSAAQPLVGEVNEFMTGQLAIFIQQNGRLPKDFAEFSRARLDSVPRTPQGMKWAIDTVTREVKLVKQ